MSGKLLDFHSLIFYMTILTNLIKDTYLSHDVAEAHAWHPNNGGEKFDCLQVLHDPGGCYVRLDDHAEYLGGCPKKEPIRRQQYENEEEQCVEKMESAVGPSSSRCYSKYRSYKKNIKSES